MIYIKNTYFSLYSAILMSIPHILDLETAFTSPKHVVIIHILAMVQLGFWRPGRVIIMVVPNIKYEFRRN